MSDRVTLPTTSGVLASPLFWAIAASAVVHSALVIMPGSWPDRSARAAAPDPGVLLQAALVTPLENNVEAPAERAPELLAPNSPSPSVLPAQDLAPPPVANTPPAAAASSAPKPVASPALAIRGAADLDVDGQLLAEHARLGDYLSRQLSEFPVELDFPVRLNESIRVHYPAAALAAGREDSVVVWVVVDAQGIPDEIAVVEGSDEFADAVVAAVKAAHFIPARNNLQPIRFPVSLEFQFVAGPPATASAQAGPIGR
jgi:TonB family protein